MVLDTYLPQCLAMGIGAEEFWKMNIRKLRPFLKAEEIKFEKRNRELHLLGQYTHDAVAIALANAFRRAGDEAIEYPAKPYTFISQKEYDKRKRDADLQRWEAQFAQFAEGVRKRLEKEHEL